MADDLSMCFAPDPSARSADEPASATVSNMVPALVRGLRLMQVFSTARPRLPMSELVTYLDAPRSTVARLVRSLVALGFLQEDGAGRFSPGPSAMGVSVSFLLGSVVLRLAAPILDRLAKHALATAQLLALDGDEVVVLAQALPANMSGACVATRVGARFAIAQTALSSGAFGAASGGLLNGVQSGGVGSSGVQSSCRERGAQQWACGEAASGSGHAGGAALPLMTVPILRDGRLAYAISVGVQEEVDAASAVERAKLALVLAARDLARTLNHEQCECGLHRKMK